MSSDEEREVYEIIASMPIDTKRIDVLKDITFEAQLLMRSKFVRKITISYEDFKKIYELGKDKEILLTTNLEGKRFLIYIDHGRIVSTAVSDPKTSKRVVGLRPLATLILASRIKPLSFKLFEVQKEFREDVTRETPRRIYAELRTKREEKTEKKPGEKARSEEGKPVILEFSKKLKEFLDRITSELQEVAPFYGCKTIDVKIELSRGVLALKVFVTKKGLFSRCKVDKLEDVLAGDVDLILSMLDLDIPYRIEVKEVKK